MLGMCYLGARWGAMSCRPRGAGNNKLAKGGIQPWIWAKLGPTGMARRGEPRYATPGRVRPRKFEIIAFCFGVQPRSSRKRPLNPSGYPKWPEQDVHEFTPEDGHHRRGLLGTSRRLPDTPDRPFELPRSCPPERTPTSDPQSNFGDRPRKGHGSTTPEHMAVSEPMGSPQSTMS